MSELRLDWRGEEAKRHIRSKTLQALTRAALAIKRRARELLSVPGSGRIDGRKRGPATHAAEGEPPRKQTGALRASVDYEVDANSLQARVGTNLRYGRHLELGEGVNPHPWLRRAAYESAEKVNGILGGIESDAQ